MSEAKNNDHNHSHSQNNSFQILVTGAVIGAVLTYLFTTESGKKIKDELIREGSRLLDSIGDEVEKAKSMVEDGRDLLVADVDQKKQEIAQEIHQAAKEVKKEMKVVQADIQDLAEEVPHQVEEIQKKGRRFFFSKKPSTHES
ncbi:MAG: YtxH domain-containing protein [Patescibacteria group bacterium]